jgi:pectate lyase
MSASPGKWVLLLGLFLAACHSEPTENVGGETSWLRACRVDSDCSGADVFQSCNCGVCVRACADLGCDADEICVQPSSRPAVALCQSVAPEPLCVPRCGSGGCRRDYACLDQACVPSTGVSSLAFPGAEGFGARVSGGRGGKLVRVTTLAADGPGSLNEALAMPFPRIIVFEVSGVIAAPSFEIAEGDVTIAGQTAPGAGITLTGPLRGRYDPSVGNIVIRHLRLRPQYDGSDVTQYDALQLSKNHHLMIDHVSAAFAVDETIDLFEAKDVTVQWSSIETIDDRDNPTGRYIRGIVAGTDSARISVHHQLCIHDRGSCVSIAGGPAELVSSHFQDVRAAFTHSAASHGQFSFVSNTFYSGPNLTLLPFVFDDEAATAASDLAYYLDDNQLLDATIDCSQGNLDDPWGCTYGVGRGVEYRSRTPFDFASLSPTWLAVTSTASSELAAQLLPRVGAHPRDVVTAQAIADVGSQTGILDPEYPADLLEGLSVSDAPLDSDHDGMPDAWESAHALDPFNAADQNVILNSGYAAIEEYLNQRAATLLGEGP